MLLTVKHIEEKIQRSIGCNPLNDEYIWMKMIQNFVYIIIFQISNFHEKLFIHFFKKKFVKFSQKPHSRILPYIIKDNW